MQTQEDRTTALPEGSILRFAGPDGAPRLGRYQGATVIDLGARTLAEVLASGVPLGAVAPSPDSDTHRQDLTAIRLLAPIDDQEVWAAGVTYLRSREAREQESEHAADMYTRVYGAERPELFWKGDARRTAGPGGTIRVRDDSRWSVPEPELALVIGADLRIAGFTIGNDVSARDIEGENPLYLPQAKVWDGACALGPAIVPAEAVADPYQLRISCAILRDGAIIWRDETSTAQLHRRFDELIAYLGRHNSFPAGVFLLTGTCLVPPDTLSLRSGDTVEIGIDGLGLLRNVVA